MSRELFDPWPTHGNLVFYPYPASLGSGAFDMACSFYLNDGQEWFYAAGLATSYLGIQQIVDWGRLYVPTGYPVAAPGEGFNRRLRKMFVLKFTPLEFLAYVTSH